MKTVIIYHSYHHGNTKKLVEAVAQGREITLIDAAIQKEADLAPYGLIGFASGVYFGKFHESVLAFARKSLPENKRVFFLCTYGGGGGTKAISDIAKSKSAEILGEFGCKAYDTFGPFKLMGGINKGRPNAQDLEDARRFFDRICGKP